MLWDRAQPSEVVSRPVNLGVSNGEFLLRLRRLMNIEIAATVKTVGVLTLVLMPVIAVSQSTKESHPHLIEDLTAVRSALADFVPEAPVLPDIDAILSYLADPDRDPKILAARREVDAKGLASALLWYIDDDWAQHGLSDRELLEVLPSGFGLNLLGTDGLPPEMRVSIHDYQYESLRPLTIDFYLRKLEVASRFFSTGHANQTNVDASPIASTNAKLAFHEVRRLLRPELAREISAGQLGVLLRTLTNSGGLSDDTLKIPTLGAVSVGSITPQDAMTALKYDFKNLIVGNDQFRRLAGSALLASLLDLIMEIEAYPAQTHDELDVDGLIKKFEEISGLSLTRQTMPAFRKQLVKSEAAGPDVLLMREGDLGSLLLAYTDQVELDNRLSSIGEQLDEVARRGTSYPLVERLRMELHRVFRELEVSWVGGAMHDAGQRLKQN